MQLRSATLHLLQTRLRLLTLQLRHGMRLHSGVAVKESGGPGRPYPLRRLGSPHELRHSGITHQFEYPQFLHLRASTLSNLPPEKAFSHAETVCFPLEMVLSSHPNPKLVIHRAPEPQPRRSGGRAWWIAIPSILSIALTVLAIVLLVRTLDLQDALRETERQSAKQVADLANAQKVLDTISAPDSIRVTLTTPASRQPAAQAVYQRDRGRLVLVASNLTQLMPGHVYQLWLLPPQNAAPIPAGTFTPDERGHASIFTAMPPNIEASGFVVTVEPKGGTLTPTTKPILSGSIS